MAHVTGISDSFILERVFLKENNFKLDLKNNEPISNSDDIAVFTTKCEDIKPVHQVLQNVKLLYLEELRRWFQGLLT